MRSFRVSSALSAPPDVVWRHASSLAGVNRELRPLARMTSPPGGPEVRAGALGRSWVLLLGLLPVDADDLHLERVDPGRGFRERSTLLTASRWHHDRTLEPLSGGGCRVIDEIAFAPRVRALGPLQERLFAFAFWHRHRRLRGIFGGG